MPRLYVTTTELAESPLGSSPLIAQYLATAGPGSVDKMLARASQRVDTYCRKRIQAPGASTLSANALAGALSISVASTLTLDNEAEQAVQIGTGGTQEIVPIAPGGITVTSWATPYPGTIALAQPLVYSHNSGDACQYLYQEVSITSHASSEDPFSEAFTQEAQLAQIHAPVLAKGIDLTRIIFLKHYPVASTTSILRMEYTYSYDTTYYQIIPIAVAVTPASGFTRFRVGTVILPNANFRTTYIGGYGVVPDDVKLACEDYVRDEVSKYFNPLGLLSQHLGKRSSTYRSGTVGSPNVQDAQCILKKYRRNI
jgi:hypothetical protein